MTAALANTVALVRRLNGRCRPLQGGVLAYDGDTHADCSTCLAPHCGGDDMGLAGAGVDLVRKGGRLALRWVCPGCGASVTEATTWKASADHAREIASDALCHGCRAKGPTAQPQPVVPAGEIVVGVGHEGGEASA